MKKFYHLKIAQKLLLSFCFILLMMIGSGIFSIVQLNRLNGTSSEIANNWLPSIKTLGDIKLLLARLRSNEAQLLLFDDEEKMRETLVKRTELVLVDLHSQLQLYETQISEPEEKAVYPKVREETEKLLAKHDKFIATINSHSKDQAKQIFAGESSDIYFSLLASVSKLEQINRTGGNKSAEEAKLVFSSSRIWIVSILAAALMVGLFLSYLIAHAISKPLTIAVGIAQKVAAGNLATDIYPSGYDEVGDLMVALKQMNDSLRDVVRRVRAGTETIEAASHQIASGNLDLSSRTEEQASSLEETASSMEEIASTVKQNSENAKYANQLAIAASGIAADAGKVVSQVVDTMSSISESSSKIVEIIDVINGIAFQTNILALNAAVEAARAGEQGKGFAVVASEVRSLAQRSTGAAKEIKWLIDSSVTQVGEGNRLAKTAGETMAEVVSSVQRVANIVSEIADASDEQSQGIDEINRAISQMDQVTQQNATLVEEAAAASQSLENQVLSLATTVSVFKVDTGAETGNAVAVLEADLNVIQQGWSLHDLSRKSSMALTCQEDYV